MRWCKVFLGMVLVLATTSFLPTQSAGASSAFIALVGAQARDFVLPESFRLERSGFLARLGLRRERYQQYQQGVPILGGEITLHRDRAGDIVLAIGDAYPPITLANEVRLGRARARRIAERRVGLAGEWQNRLMIDPVSRRCFYRVASRRFASHWHYWIDAENGRVLRRYNGLTTGEGLGVKGDIKDLTGLTTSRFRRFRLQSDDGRQLIRDARSRPLSQILASILPAFLVGRIARDADDDWFELGRASPGQAALVDAAYYTAVTDEYYQIIHGRDSFDGEGRPITAVAHFSTDFSNAFWNGRFMVFGDGDGHSFLEFSGALALLPMSSRTR